MDLSDRPSLDQMLLNDWQRDFPLETAPFDAIARSCCSDADTVLSTYRTLMTEGSISRIGGVWGAGAGGAAMLCALAVPPERLAHVADIVNALEGVNHNYEREHHYNLWFVVTGLDQVDIHTQVDQIETQSGLTALRLPMVRPYRIDLGFDLRQTLTQAHPGEPCSRTHRRVPAVLSEERPLATLVEAGLPLTTHPYRAWAHQLAWTETQVLDTLRRWQRQGTLRRFGAIVRHHDLGIRANAMTVLDVPDAEVDAAGRRMASQPGITLCYRRQRHPNWPFNLYFMVHGQCRDAVQQAIDTAVNQAGIAHLPRQSLFSGQRFKQTGGRYFSRATQPLPQEIACAELT